VHLDHEWLDRARLHSRLPVIRCHEPVLALTLIQRRGLGQEPVTLAVAWRAWHGGHWCIHPHVCGREGVAMWRDGAGAVTCCRRPPRVCEREGLEGVAAGVVAYTLAFASEERCRRVDWRLGAYTPNVCGREGCRQWRGVVWRQVLSQRPPRVCEREGVAAWGHVVTNTPYAFVSTRGRRGWGGGRGIIVYTRTR
jgi:hypothetical protein